LDALHSLFPMSTTSNDGPGPSKSILLTEKFRNLVRRRGKSKAETSDPTTDTQSSSPEEQDNSDAPFTDPTSLHSPTPLNHRDSLLSDCSSLMLYSPLQPTEELAVELAVSEWREWRPMTFEELFVFDNDRREKELEDGVSEVALSDGSESVQSTRRVRVWIPSRTQLSFQFLWWGYRIYLPPPVLAVLNNKRLEAAKRAAIITAAIQWLLNHIPAQTLPPQLHPFAALLSQLPSLTGQAGALLAWSWSAVQTFDQGHGVILTATWVLPIILLPSTWRPEPDDPQTSETLATFNRSQLN